MSWEGEGGTGGCEEAAELAALATGLRSVLLEEVTRDGEDCEVVFVRRWGRRDDDASPRHSTTRSCRSLEDPTTALLTQGCD